MLGPQWQEEPPSAAASWPGEVRLLPGRCKAATAHRGCGFSLQKGVIFRVPGVVLSRLGTPGLIPAGSVHRALGCRYPSVNLPPPPINPTGCAAPRLAFIG